MTRGSALPFALPAELMTRIYGGRRPPPLIICAENLRNFTGPPGRENFAIIGYYWLAKRPGYRTPSGFTPNTMTNMLFRDPETDRWIQKMTDRTSKSTPSELVLMSDIVISRDDTRNWQNNNFITVYGGYFRGHGTTHRAGAKPLGGNNLYLDGHVEWRSFDMMRNRLHSWPHFWY